ncbi:MAG: SH3 domain-containing protein [Candidatus Omnitrophota bacterium]
MKNIIFFFILFLSILSINAYPAELFQIVEDGINIRSDATVMSTDLGHLKKGETIRVVGERYQWYKIILPKRFTCFVLKEHTVAVNELLVTVSAARLNARKEPSLDSEIMGTLEKGLVLRIVEKRGDWLETTCYPHVNGWVHSKFLKPK